MLTAQLELPSKEVPRTPIPSPKFGCVGEVRGHRVCLIAQLCEGVQATRSSIQCCLSLMRIVYFFLAGRGEWVAPAYKV